MTATIGDALAIATIAHSGQPYGDEPYINHPVRVAKLILDSYGPKPHLLIPALLHDVIEDSGVTAFELIRLGFSSRDVGTVESVTRHHNEPYPALIKRACADIDGRIVKLADNTDNLSGLKEGDYRIGKYVRARKALVEANGGEDFWAHLVRKHIPL